MEEVKKGTLSLTSARQEVRTHSGDFSSFGSVRDFFPYLTTLLVVRKDFNKVLRPLSPTELQRLLSCHSFIHHWVSLAKHLLTMMNRNLPMLPQEALGDIKDLLLTLRS